METTKRSGIEITISTFAGLIKKGLASERPTHAAYLTDFLYYSTDTGALDWDNGTAWIPLQGPTKAEILQNKIISTTNNTLTGITQDPFTSARREGFIRPSLTAAGSLSYALNGFPSAGGTYSLFYDTTEGYISRFLVTSINKIGWYSDTSPIISRREWATRVKIRMRSSMLTNTNIYFGFSNAAAALVFSSSTIPFQATEQGFAVGFNVSNANFASFKNDGGGSAPTVTSFGSVAKDTTFRTFEIIMSDTNIVCSLDGANTQTHTTFIPALTTDLKFGIQMHSFDTVTKNFDIAKASFSSDIT